MPQPRPGKYYIQCELNPKHRVLDLPSQYAHQQSGLVHAITGNQSEYQKWVVEQVPGTDLFTIRANLVRGRFIEPDRGLYSPFPVGADRNADGLLLCFFPQTAGEYQQWRFEETVQPNVYFIQNAGTRKYWDLRAQDPSHIQQLPKKNVPHQLWILVPAT